MDNDSIENNPSYQKFKKELEGMEAIQRLIKFLSISGLSNEQLDNAFSSLPDFKKQLEVFSKSPDKFNNHFAKRGWIAHESMNQDLMCSSIDLAEQGSIEEAEQELINYYSSDRIEWLVRQLKWVDAFSIRHNFFQLAYEDTLSERYYSAVPILLMMIDGAVNEIDKGKGFFADNTDLTAWDSIAGHSTGLMALKEVFIDRRVGTTTESIDLPFRHGILHGRDLGYANKTVTAKCWATVFAIKDWAVAIEQGKKHPPAPDPELTLDESISQLIESIGNYSESKKRTAIITKKIENWKPRQLQIGIDIPEKGNPTDYDDFTPEQEAIRFIEYWTHQNFGEIAKQIHRFSKTPINVNKEAGILRNIFEDKILIDYKIVNVVDCSPAISEITLVVAIECNGKQYEKHISLRFLYEGLSGETLIFGDKGGQWKFVDNFFHEL